MTRSKVKVTRSKFKKDLEDSKCGALDPSGLNSRKSKRKRNGIRTQVVWFQKSGEKNKKGHWIQVVEILGNPKNSYGNQPKWFNLEIEKELKGEPAQGIDIKSSRNSVWLRSKVFDFSQRGLTMVKVDWLWVNQVLNIIMCTYMCVGTLTVTRTSQDLLFLRCMQG